MSNHSRQIGFFIKGDISGIQEFIFNVKSEKAARVLKARSAYILLYTRIVLQYLEQALEMHGKPMLFSEGGGSFFLHLQNSNVSAPDIKKIVKEAERLANEKAMIDDLYMVLSVVTYQEVDDFKSYWKKITKTSNKEKLQKYTLAGNESDTTRNPFTPFSHDEKNHDWIGFAHEFVKREMKEIVKTELNLKDIELFKEGIDGLLTRFSLPERVITDLREGFFKDKIQDKLPEWHPALYCAFSDDIKQELKKRNQGITDKKEEEKIRPYDIIDYSFLAYFAGERTGTEKLGILKMDVDSLGLLFQYQTDRTEAERVSKEIKSFFEERLYEMLQRNIKHDYDTGHREVNPDKYRDNIYTVFAGGDDCFFVGGWDTILDWAALVRKEFKEYVIDTKRNIIHPKTGKIPTISAGVVIVDAKFPVIRFAELAEEALSKAKASNRNEQKNKICLFDQVLTWDEFAKAAKWSKDLKGLIENNEKKSMLERIKRSAIGYEKLQEKATTGRVSAPKVANLFYYVRRNANENNITLLEDLVTQYTNALLLAFLSSRKGEPIIMNPMLLPIAARWAEFLTRKNTKSDKNGKG